MTELEMPAIQWDRRMQMRGGKIGLYRGICEVTGKRRVIASNRYDEWTDDKDTYTTWLCDDAGRCRGDKKPCDQDCIGPVKDQTHA